MAKGAESLPVFSRCYANVSVFWREIKETPTYLSSKSKKIRDRVDSRVQLVWRLRVMSSEKTSFLISLDVCLSFSARCFTSVLTRAKSVAIMVNLIYVGPLLG